MVTQVLQSIGDLESWNQEGSERRKATDGIQGRAGMSHSTEPPLSSPPQLLVNQLIWMQKHLVGEGRQFSGGMKGHRSPTDNRGILFTTTKAVLDLRTWSLKSRAKGGFRLIS